MKRSRFITYFIILVILFAAIPSFAGLHEWYEGYKLEPYWYKSYNPLRIQYPNGLVLDLIKNRISTRGEYPISGLLTYSNRTYIEQKAQESSIHNLIEKSLDLRVDTNRRLYNFTKNDPDFKEKIRQRIKATVSLIHYRIFTMKRTLRVTSVVQYKGPNSLLNVIFPHLIAEELGSIEVVASIDETDIAEEHEEIIESETEDIEEEIAVFENLPSSTPEVENIKIYGTYSGLIIDARGLKVEPAINPYILDEYGTKVFGNISDFDLKLLYKRGKTGYFRTLNAAKANYRAGKNPLYIKAVKAERNCNPIVSFKDAYRIIEENKMMGFLDNLYVSIII